MTLLAAPAWAISDRHAVDHNDLAGLDRMYPEAGKLLREGESLLAAGKPDAAAKVLRRAYEMAPNNPLVPRRYCQALALLSKQTEALVACRSAIELRVFPTTSRAYVRALMLDRQPTPEELGMALLYVHNAKKNLPQQPWGLAADCDIAVRLGDAEMEQSCVKQLQALAPTHYETLNAEARMRGAGPPLASLLGAFAMAVALLGTGLHAAWSALQQKRSSLRMAAALKGAALALLTLLIAPHALAEDTTQDPTMAQPGGLSKWKVDDKDPRKTVPPPSLRDRDPLNYGYHIMDLLDKADAAKQKGDWAGAAKYYEGCAKAAADSAICYRKACEAWEEAKEPAKALAFCKGALGVNGTELNDSLHYTRLLMGKPGDLTPEDLADVEEITNNVRKVESGEITAARIQCELGVRLSDQRRLEDCTGVLGKAGPTDPATISYRWALAIAKGDFDGARNVVALAKKSNLPAAAIAAMETGIAKESTLTRRLQRKRAWVWGALVLMFGAVGLFVFSRRRPRATVPLSSSAAQTAI